MNADLWISALENLILILLIVHVVIAAILGWILAVIARVPIWLGIALCVVLPVVGALAMTVTAVVRQIRRARAVPGPRAPAPRVAARVGLAAVPAAALLLLCVTLALPWFRVPLENGFPLKVSGHVIGAETAVLFSTGVLASAIILAACAQPLWAGAVQIVNAGFWSAASATVLTLLKPVQALLRDYAKLRMTVDDGMDSVGIDKSGVPDIPELPIPEPIRDFVPFLPQEPIDVGAIDVTGSLPRFGIHLGVSWWFVFAVIALTIGFSVFSVIKAARDRRSERRRAISDTAAAPISPVISVPYAAAGPTPVTGGAQTNDIYPSAPASYGGQAEYPAEAAWSNCAQNSAPPAQPPTVQPPTAQSPTADDFEDPWKDVL
jgi:hypothetical protein